MADVNIGGTLPVGDANGLTALAAELISDPHRPRVMIAVIDCAKVTTKTDTGERIATVRVRRIERVLVDDLGAAEKLMRRALEYRVGRDVLPLDLEDEIREVFAALDPATLADEAADDDTDDGPDDTEPGP